MTNECWFTLHLGQPWSVWPGERRMSVCSSGRRLRHSEIGRWGEERWNEERRGWRGKREKRGKCIGSWHAGKEAPLVFRRLVNSCRDTERRKNGAIGREVMKVWVQAKINTTHTHTYTHTRTHWTRTNPQTNHRAASTLYLSYSHFPPNI